MKTRAGFVSNSSSSSFIVISSNGTTPKAYIEVDLEDMVDFTIKNEEDLENYVIKGMYYKSMQEFLTDPDEYDFARYESFKGFIDDGLAVRVCRATSDEGGLEEAIYSVGSECLVPNSSDVLIISEDG